MTMFLWTLPRREVDDEEGDICAMVDALKDRDFCAGWCDAVDVDEFHFWLLQSIPPLLHEMLGIYFASSH